jgi:hypothetical protein
MSERRAVFSRTAALQDQWVGQDRRKAKEPIDRAEFEGEIKGIHIRLDDQDGVLKSIHGALFDKDDTGQHKHIGLIVMFEEINNHMKVVCNFARWFKWAVVSLGTIAGGYLAISKAMGWS